MQDTNMNIRTSLSSTSSLCSLDGETKFHTHTYKTGDKIIVLAVVVHIFLDSKHEDERL